MERVSHPFPPIFDAHARILILGSLPSAASREQGFYYGHPRNRFWPLLARLYGCAQPVTAPDREALLLAHGLALWDVVKSCDISGSSDAAIRNICPQDLSPLFAFCPKLSVVCNGQTAGRLYGTHCRPRTGRDARTLPSTSPANAAWTMERLAETWGEALLR